MNYYKFLESVLIGDGIYNADDFATRLKDCESDKASFMQKYIEIIENQTEKIESNILTDKLLLSIDYKTDIAGQILAFGGVNASVEQIDHTKKYACLLPGKTQILTFRPIKEDAQNVGGYCNDFELSDYIFRFFEFKDLLINDIMNLYPHHREEEWNFRFHRVSGNPKIFNHLNFVQKHTFSEVSKGVYAIFPWLYNARIDDYLDIKSKHPLEFQYFTKQINNICRCCNRSKELDEKVFSEIDEALINIRIHFENKKKQLQAKGIRCAVGLAGVFLPLISEQFSAISNFTPFVGGITLLEASGLFYEINQLNKESNTDPFWTCWRWGKNYFS